LRIQATGVIYVSNINGAVMQKEGNGFISRLTADGKMLERQWVKGLNSPTGLALHDRTLYAADVDQAHRDQRSLGRNPQALRRQGRGLPQRRGGRRRGDCLRLGYADEYDLAPQGRELRAVARQRRVERPNGLLIQGKTLIVASLGKVQSQGQKKELGTLLAVSLDDQKVSKVGKGELIGNLDGLQAIQPGVYLVTDWAQGALYRVDAKGKGG
jgi:hypothetical protein